MSVRLELSIGSGGTGGGTIATGMLQLAAGVPLDTTLRAVTDQANTVSPLQLSTTTIGATENIFFQAEYKNIGRDGNNAVRFATGEIRLSVGSSGNILFYDAGTATNFLTANKNGVAIGHTTASARLHVRGDGTNPIARFEDNTGINYISITYPSGIPTLIWSDGSYYQMGPSGHNVYSANTMVHYGVWGTNAYAWSWQPVNSMSAIAGTQKLYNFNGTFASAAGSASPRLLDIAYTINNSGAQSGTATGIFLNATETALNGMTHNLIDLQESGISRFKVSGTGRGDFLGDLYANTMWSSNGTFRTNNTGTRLTSTVDGIWLMLDNAGTDFNRLQFGGTTNLYGAIKRNGTEFQFKLADDSAFTRVECSQLKVNSGLFMISNVALTNGAAAGAGTITNAPAAGNPTKWIPIDDNGTIRYIPCW